MSTDSTSTTSQPAKSIIPPGSEKQHPEVRKLWWITLVVQATIGVTNGLYLYTWGPYFYEKFGGTIHPGTAMLLTTVLLGIRQGLVALLELPTGALADTIGRVQVVTLSWIVRALFFISLAAIWLCDSVVFAFMWGVLASITFAFSYTFFNGAFSAWCVETLREKAPQVSYGWLASRFFSYRSFSEILGGLVAIFLYLKGMVFMGFVVAAILSFCGLSFSMNKMEEVTGLHFLKVQQVQFSTITRRIGEIIGKAAQVCSKTPVLFWILLTFGSYMFLLNLVAYLWPVYFKSKFGSSATFGRDWIFIMVGSQLLMTLSSRFLVWLNKKWTMSGGVKAHLIGFRRIFVGTSLLSALAILLLSWDTAYHQLDWFTFPTAVIVVILSFGIIAPCFETLINAYIPESEAQERATIISAGSMLRSLMVLILAVPSGGTSGETSPINWAIPAALLLFATLVANAFMRRAAREKMEMEMVAAQTATK